MTDDEQAMRARWVAIRQEPIGYAEPVEVTLAEGALQRAQARALRYRAQRLVEQAERHRVWARSLREHALALRDDVSELRDKLGPIGSGWGGRMSDQPHDQPTDDPAE